MTDIKKLLSAVPIRTGHPDMPYAVRYENAEGRVMVLACETRRAAMDVIRQHQPTVRDQLAASLSGGWN